MPMLRHIVPHTHWDREWYRTFQQFRIRLVRLIDRLLDILAKDETYCHFMLDGQTRLLEDYLEIRPERKDELARLVQEGRLTIGPWFILPDEFLVAPESLLRNLLLGAEISQRFGKGMAVGYVPDLFGHIAQLPQIFRGFGIDNAVLRRGLADEPVELWWDAPDGSRVLVCYLRNGYDNATRLPMTSEAAFVSAIQTASQRLQPYVQSGHILLMAGNDHQEPDPRLPQLIRFSNQGQLGSDVLQHSSLPAYVLAVYEAVKKLELMTVQGELRSPKRHHLLPGVLSTRIWMKQRNDAIETLLLSYTEPLAAWAELLDNKDVSMSESHAHQSGQKTLAYVKRNAALIWQAWRLLLDNHPHDSICGCSIDQVHREMAVRFDQSEQIAEAIATLSLSTVADQVDTSGFAAEHAQALIVFNPTSGPRTDVVKLQVCLAESADGYELFSADGRVLSHSVAIEPVPEEEKLFFYRELSANELTSYLSMVRGGRLLNYVIHQIRVIARGQEAHVQLSISKEGTPNRAQVALAQAKLEDLLARAEVSRFIIRTLMAEPTELTFVAPDLPAYGYSSFSIRPATSSKVSGTMPTPKDLSIENDFFFLQVDPDDGSLTLTDKRSGAVYPGLNRFVDGGDRGDTYTYCQPEQDELVTEPAEPPLIRVLTSNAVQQLLELRLVYALPRSLSSNREKRSEETIKHVIVSRVHMYTGVPRIDIETLLNNQAEDHRLRVHFPVPLRVDHAFNETHFHVARRLLPQVDTAEDTSDWMEQPVATVPQRGWADLNNGHIGLMLANRGLPEVEFIASEETDRAQTSMALTLLRSVGWLSRDDIHSRKGRAGSILAVPDAQCLGQHHFHYSLIPHEGSWENVRAEAEAFRAPLRAVVSEIHQGILPPSSSLVEVQPSTFRLTTLKQAQDEKGLIVRGINMSDQAITVLLKPWQVFARALRTDLKEEALEPLKMAENGSVSLTLKPWEIATIKWEL